MAPGHNAPPFHPNCKCTTVPYLEKEKDRVLFESNDKSGKIEDDCTAKNRTKRYFY